MTVNSRTRASVYESVSPCATTATVAATNSRSVSSTHHLVERSRTTSWLFPDAPRTRTGKETAARSRVPPHGTLLPVGDLHHRRRTPRRRLRRRGIRRPDGRRRRLGGSGRDPVVEPRTPRPRPPPPAPDRHARPRPRSRQAEA